MPNLFEFIFSVQFPAAVLGAFLLVLLVTGIVDAKISKWKKEGEW